jgi:hypothetical protein
MELQHSVELDKLAPALSSLQGELPHVGKDSKGYGYNYADLAATLDVLKPLLVKYGFSVTQYGSGNSLVLCFCTTPDSTLRELWSLSTLK